MFFNVDNFYIICNKLFFVNKKECIICLNIFYYFYDANVNDCYPTILYDP